MSHELSFRERKEIEKGLKLGKSCCCIGLEIRRSKNCIVTEVRNNGGKGEYSAVQAQDRAYALRQEKYERLAERNKTVKPSFEMKKRIENLEMQVEILYDTIKEILYDKKNKRI